MRTPARTCARMKGLEISMKRFAWLLFVLSLPAAAQPYKMAVIGLVHSHVWGHLPRMAKSSEVKLVGIAESIPDLVAEAKKVVGETVPIYSDYKKMLDEAKPDLVWSFVANNQHLEIVQACAPRGIHVMFEKPLAATYKESLAVQALARKHHRSRNLGGFAQHPGGEGPGAATQPLIGEIGFECLTACHRAAP